MATLKLLAVGLGVLRVTAEQLSELQKWNDVIVFDSAPGDLFANLPKWDSPLPQECPLVVANVFIQQIHAARRLTWRCLNFP